MLANEVAAFALVSSSDLELMGTRGALEAAAFALLRGGHVDLKLFGSTRALEVAAFALV